MSKSQLTSVSIVSFTLLLVVGICMYLMQSARSKAIQENNPIASSQKANLYGKGEKFSSTQDKKQVETNGREKWGEEFINSIVDKMEKDFDPSTLPMRKRIAQDVEMLRKETLQDSLSLLSEIEMFYWPGEIESETFFSMPLRTEEGSWEGNAILSNRRFLKIYQELRDLPSAKASELINAELETLLPQYLMMLEKTWKQLLAIRTKNSGNGIAPNGAGPSLLISNNPDHSPTLSGARLKILSLLLIAGNLKLSDSAEETKKIVSLALNQREMFYDAQTGLKGDRFGMLTRVTLYNRQILATALLGVTNAPQVAEEKRWKTSELTAYDAAFTPYDLMTRHGGPLPVDYTKGKQIVKTHVPLDDPEFDSMVSKLKISP